MELGEAITLINWVDVLVLILLFRISYVGFNRGLSSEIIPLIGTFVAFIVALRYNARIGNLIAAHTFISDAYSNIISYLALAFFILYLSYVVEGLIIGRVVTVHITSLVDNIGGLVAGITRSLLLISIVLVALELTPLEYVNNSLKERSLLGKRFLKIGKVIYTKTSAFFRVNDADSY